MKRPSFFGCRLIWVQHPLHPSAVTGQCGPLSVLSLSLSFLFVTDTAYLGWESGERTQKGRQQKNVGLFSIFSLYGRDGLVLLTYFTKIPECLT